MPKNIIKFREIFEDLGVGIAVVNDKGYPVYCNKYLCNLLQYEEKELLNKNFEEFTHKEDIDIDKTLYSDLINNKITYYNLEKRYITKFNEIIWAKLSVSIYNKQLNYSLAIVQDITKEKNQLKKLKSLNSELEEFAYLTSHDLREPFNNIANLTELFMNEYKSLFDQYDDAKFYMDFINKASIRGRAVIEDLLDYSRVKGSKKELEIINLNSLTENIIEDYYTIINEKDVEIFFNFDINLVNVRKGEFNSLFKNLISNAIKFSSNRRKNKIEISNEFLDSFILFKFKDTGIGIDKKHHDKIFKIFKRLHNRDDFEGTGIGLALCQKIIQTHGGDIWVDSKEGEGSTFYFTIPITY